MQSLETESSMVENAQLDNHQITKNQITEDQIGFEEYEWKRVIEANLFLSPNPLSFKDLKENLKQIPPEKIKPLVLLLQQDYLQAEGALEISIIKNMVELRAKNKILRDTRLDSFTSGKDLSAAETKTLAFIAYNQPAEYQDILDFIGRGAKKSIQSLTSRGLIEYKVESISVLNEEAEEVTMKIKEYHTTSGFADYFGIENNVDSIREKLNQILE